MVGSVPRPRRQVSHRIPDHQRGCGRARRGAARAALLGEQVPAGPAAKRGGGRRYYRPEDVDLLRQIRSLLYEEGYTIKGAQKLLANGAPRQSTARWPRRRCEPCGNPTAATA